MVDSCSSSELVAAIGKLETYLRSNYTERTASIYFSVLSQLKLYAHGDIRESGDIISDFYEVITGKPPFQRPDTCRTRRKSRTFFMLRDILQGYEPKRKYLYNREPYCGAFLPQLAAYRNWLQDQGNGLSSIQRKTSDILKFLCFLNRYEITSVDQITAKLVLSYLKEREADYSNGKIPSAYFLRNFLTCPAIHDELCFNPYPLLCGFRLKKHSRLKPCFTPDEIKLVMDAVDRTTKWGKTIYAMMILACVYGLRVSDIRGLQQSSIHWQKRTISLYQKKTSKYIELPLTIEAMLALLDYLKNVRPPSPDPHVFIRHRHPCVPYSQNVTFGSKLVDYFRNAGVNTDGKQCGLHSMRFSLATALLADNVPVHEIATILGHTTIESTKQYIWSDLKHLKAAALEVPVYVS